MNIKKIFTFIILSTIYFNAYSQDIYCLTDNVSCASSWQSNYDTFSSPHRNVCGADVLVSTNSTYEVHSLGKQFPGGSCITGVIRHKLIIAATCTNGSTKDFAVSSSQNVICIGGGTCNRTVTYQGCEYVTAGRSSDCFVDHTQDPADYVCNFTGTANGNVALPSSTDEAIDSQIQSEPSSCTTMNDVEVCNSAVTGCVEANSQELCFSPVAGCAIVNDEQVCHNSSKNCTLSNGKYLCILDPADPNSTSCLSNGTDSFCISDKKAVTNTETVSTVTNNDNSTTTTTTNNSNVSSSTPSISATTNNTDGSTSTVKTGPDKNQQDLSALKGIESNTKKIADNTKKTADNTKSIDDKFEQLLDTSTVQASSDSAVNDLGSSLSNDASSMASEISNTPNPFLGIANSLVSDWIPTLPSPVCSGVIDTLIFGRQFYLDPCAKLQPLRVTLEWVFYILASISIFNTIFTIRGT